MPKIKNIHHQLFKKLFGNLANIEAFLDIALPKFIRNKLDFSTLHSDSTSYFSEILRKSSFDLVIECQMKDKKHPVSIYLLLEHKSWSNKEVLVQILHYMSLTWEKDIIEKKPLRMILPLIFYHGRKKWDVPFNFVDQFDMPEDFKAFLPNFSYLFFDINDWNFDDQENTTLRDNSFMFSALLLLKAIKEQDGTMLNQVFQLWKKIGFPNQRKPFIFLEVYLAQSMDISLQELTIILENSYEKGDNFMPTLAERWKEEGREEGLERGRAEGLEKGILINSINNLISLMSVRFQLNNTEIEKIHCIKDPEKLEAALKLILKADSKETILKFLRIE